MNTIKESFIFQFLITIISKIENMIKNSWIYSLLTKEINKPKENGFFLNILYSLIRVLRKVFNFLKLNIVFKDSIFAKTEIWIGLTVAMAPILSTIQMLLLVLFTTMSFIIKICMDENFKFTYTPLNTWVIVFVLIYLFSGIISLDMMSSIKIAMLVISFMMFYFVIVNSITTKKQLKVMLNIFVIIGALVSLFGIYQYLFAGSFASSSFVDKEMFEDIKTRVNGTFDNPNVLGEYLLFVIPIIASLFFAEKSWMKKIFYMGLGGVSIICLALTYSRGCYLGILLALAVFLLLINLKWIIAFILGVIAAPAFLPQSIINRFSSIGNMADSSTSYRVSIWKGAIDMIKDYWYRPIGQGTTAFNSIYPLYSYSGVGAQHSHNLFLQLLIETGIVGIISFLGIIYKFFQTVLCGLKKTKEAFYKYCFIGFASGMIGFLLQSIFDNTWYNNKIILIFWIFVALSATTRNLSDMEVECEKN
ncbi:MAG: O-antigen ligase family protein [Clostridia bacterium]|nr:O-antigen ligase family protein [Clostridia bacterium]